MYVTTVTCSTCQVVEIVKLMQKPADDTVLNSFKYNMLIICISKIK